MNDLQDLSSWAWPFFYGISFGMSVTFVLHVIHYPVRIVRDLLRAFK